MVQLEIKKRRSSFDIENIKDTDLVLIESTLKKVGGLAPDELVHEYPQGNTDPEDKTEYFIFRHLGPGNHNVVSTYENCILYALCYCITQTESYLQGMMENLED